MCGILGLYSTSSSHSLSHFISRLTLLQHRGKDGWGVGYIRPNNHPKMIKSLGLIKQYIFNEPHPPVSCCIGHVRYSTTKLSNELQPLVGSIREKHIMLAHNGNIPTIKEYDSHYLLNKMLNSTGSIPEALIHIMNTIPVSYCILICVNNTLYAMRDRFGIRPLSIGQMEDTIYVASETRPIEDCHHLREIQPGEIVEINQDGYKTIYNHPASIYSLCAFELIYFMNPNSYIQGQYIREIRKQLGISLAKKETLIHSTDYIVSGVPNSGLIAAKAYAEQLSLPYIQFIKKIDPCQNGEDRTFILPNQSERMSLCKKKFVFDERIKDKKLIIIDDTIVRGNIIKHIIQQCKSLGAKEIHVRIPAPPVIDICQLGIAIKTKKELLIHNKTIQQATHNLQINSLQFLSISDLTMFPPNSYKECFGGGLHPDMLLLK